jgi:hypothetical protein
MLCASHVTAIDREATWSTLWLDEEPIVVRGLVVTRHPSFGNGIMFMDFEGDGEQVLHRYMNKLIGR